MITFTNTAQFCGDDSVDIYQKVRQIVDAFKPIPGRYGFTEERGFKEERLVSCHMLADALDRLFPNDLAAVHGYYSLPTIKYEHGWLQTGKDGDYIDVYPIADYTGTPRLYPWAWASASGLFEEDAKVQREWRTTKEYDAFVRLLAADLKNVGKNLGITFAD